jgi:hypothetical protein
MFSTTALYYTSSSVIQSMYLYSVMSKTHIYLNYVTSYALRFPPLSIAQWIALEGTSSAKEDYILQFL